MSFERFSDDSPPRDVSQAETDAFYGTSRSEKTVAFLAYYGERAVRYTAYAGLAGIVAAGGYLAFRAATMGQPNLDTPGNEISPAPATSDCIAQLPPDMLHDEPAKALILLQKCEQDNKLGGPIVSTLQQGN